MSDVALPSEFVEYQPSKHEMSRWRTRYPTSPLSPTYMQVYPRSSHLPESIGLIGFSLPDNQADSCLCTTVIAKYIGTQYLVCDLAFLQVVRERPATCLS